MQKGDVCWKDSWTGLHPLRYDAPKTPAPSIFYCISFPSSGAESLHGARLQTACCGNGWLSSPFV